MNGRPVSVLFFLVTLILTVRSAVAGIEPVTSVAAHFLSALSASRWLLRPPATPDWNLAWVGSLKPLPLAPPTLTAALTTHTCVGPARGCVRSGGLWLSEKRTDVHPQKAPLGRM